MRKRKRFLFLSNLLFIAIAFLFYHMILGIEVTKSVSATLYVNGKQLEMPALIYWRGKTALVQFPLYTTLESLGCQVQRDGQEDDSSITIVIGTQEFVIKEDSFSSDLYKEDRIIYSDMARPTTRGGRGVKGQRYLDDRNYVKVLTILGFKNIVCEIDEGSRVVKLYAELDR